MTHSLNISKKIFFASDFHLGVPNLEKSHEREQKIIAWLEHIRPEAEAIFLLGDLFDFWFEYKQVVPRGYIRFLGKIAELKDAGIPIYFFTGNHDIWMFDYFPTELGIPVFREPQEWIINSKKFLLGHGDGLGPGDYKYKTLKRLFTNPLAQWLFARLHPNFSIGVASYFSRSSRKKNLKKQADEHFLGEDKEWLVQYCKQVEKENHYDYYIFGHRHLALDIQINQKSRYINTGEWFKGFNYAYFDGKDVVLTEFKD